MINSLFYMDESFVCVWERVVMGGGEIIYMFGAKGNQKKVLDLQGLTSNLFFSHNVRYK